MRLKASRLSVIGPSECAPHFNAHQRAMTLPAARAFRPVLVDLSRAMEALCVHAPTVLELVEARELPYVFDVRTTGARRCLRFWLGALLGARPASDMDALDSIVGRPHATTLLRSTVADIMLVKFDHVVRLERSRLLRNVPGGVTRASVIEFLIQRRVS